ncbi:hypothetical protein SDC9_199464 [bioreactor metagenome]|uniref:Uncharacterized protein n=1 Tax=bioreactor metagenome TaxID=1076179 RepID=A0A645IKH8_9ZZZZ
MTATGKVSYIASFVIQKGLREAAVVGFSSIFNSGDAGEGVARNRKNENVDLAREEIVKLTSHKLGCKEPDDLIEYIEEINALRNEVVAHYDGSKADYSEDNYCDLYDKEGNFVERYPTIIRTRMPSLCKLQVDIKRLKETSICLLESIKEFLIENDNASI